MENKFLQCLKNKACKKDLRDLRDKPAEELIKYIEKNFKTKEQLLAFVRASYYATQQTFWESYHKGEDVDFEILEGSVHYSPETETYTFTPNESISKLFESSKERDKTRLKDVLETRFYKIMEALFKLQTYEVDQGKKDSDKNNK